MYETSPAVERAAEAVLQAGTTPPTLAMWLLTLLDDEDGRPATLLARAGVALDDLRTTIRECEDPPPAPDSTLLFRNARELGVQLRADPSLTTDLLFLALIPSQGEMAERLSRCGLVSETLFSLLRTRDVSPGAAFDGPGFEVSDPPEMLAAARVVDASLNRAREALRVLDDHCRFVLDDHGLTERVKRLRHRLAAADSRLPGGVLIAARDTPNDVGTSVSTDREYARPTPRAVLTANLKRLQEALRSAEEYGKVLDTAFAKELEAIRYETYTLERELVRGGDARERLADARLYVLLTASQCLRAVDWVIEQAALGGADVFQLREKSLTDRELIARARQLRHWTRQAGTLFVVNDRPDIARLVEADGVHLGQDDLPVAAARRIAGPDMLIGVSTHSLDQVRLAVRDGADYIGVGPTFPSKTKSFDSFAGLEFVRAVTAETTLPAFALGGIGPDNVTEVVAAGAARIAVSAAIASTDEPRAVATALRGKMTTGRG